MVSFSPMASSASSFLSSVLCVTFTLLSSSDVHIHAFQLQPYSFTHTHTHTHTQSLASNANANANVFHSQHQHQHQYSSTPSLSASPSDVIETLSSSLNNFNLNDLNIDIDINIDLQSISSLSSSLPPLTIPLLTLTTLLTTTYNILSNPPTNYRENYEPYPRGQYNPTIARQYYSQKPLLVLRRLFQVIKLSNTFTINLLIDKYIYKLDEPRDKEKSGQDLLQVIQKVGPTAIKVGQAVSVRQDLIPKYYADALVELQDNVPPFNSDDAVDLLKNELGSEKFALLQNVDFKKPVASASIGQVYKGTAVVDVEEEIIMDGNNDDIDHIDNNGDNKKKKIRTRTIQKEIDIAIKVQRPNVLAEISLDLFLVREILAPIYAKITNTATDLQSLANEWGRGFIDELTYDQEKYNTVLFNQQMKEKNLNAILAPTVVDSLSTNRILTTEWVEGTRLDRSEEDDVARLCGVALNAYLVMLLETGTLHCDPHPGNLIRTTDGRLCILDFGMTLETPTDLQYSLLEFIAHLTAENFEEVPYDFVKLGFLKEEKVDLLVKTGALEGLYYFLRQANQGGGGTKVRERIFEEYREKYPGADEEELRQYMRQEIKDSQEQMAEKASAVTGVTMKVEDLQRENSDAFSIPEWFLYTSRAFLTLEGISLQADPDFSIVKSCFPYVAKRLLGDDSPRSQKALRDLIYGKDDEINTEKISELADGFTQYTTTTKIVSQGNGNQSTTSSSGANANHSKDSKNQRQSTEATITLVKDSADILLAPQGNLVQNLIVEESATALSAQVKDTLRDILVSNPERFRSSLPFGLGRVLPVGPVGQLEPFLKKSLREEKVQILAQKLANLDGNSAINMTPPTASQLGDLIRSSFNSNDSSSTKIADEVDNMSPEEIAILWKAIRENVPVYAPQFASLGGKFATSLLGKVSENIDTVIQNSKESDDLGDQLVRNSARGISAAAKESANVIKPLFATDSSE